MKLGTFHFQLLYHVLENIHYIYDETELAQSVLNKVSEALNAEGGSIFRIEADGRIWPLAAYGGSLEQLQKVPFKTGVGVVGWVAQHVQPLKVDDPRKDTRFAGQFDATTGFKTRSIIAAPILAKGKPIGIIEFLNRRDGPFAAPDLELISMIGREVGIAFENAGLVMRLQRHEAFLESILDSLSSGIIVCDAQGTLVAFNPRARSILGMPPAPLTGSAEDALAALPEMKELLGRAQAAEQAATRQEAAVAVAGKTLRIGYSSAPVLMPDGARLGTALIFQDLTGLRN